MSSVMRLRHLLWALASGLVAACTTGTNGPVPVGDGTYVLGRLGGITDFSGSAVKVELIREATAFCAARRTQLALLESTAKDSAPATHASAEIRFSCRSVDAASAGGG